MILQQETASKFVTTGEYRKLPHLNFSACKDFDESRSKFYKKHIAKSIIEEERSQALIFGDLVHCLLLNPEDFDNKFSKVVTGIIPKPQMKAFADNLLTVTLASLSETGEITRSINSMTEEAFNMTAFDDKGERVAFKGKNLQYVLDRFNEIEPYYQHCRESIGKDVISDMTYDRAEKCVKELKVNFVTKHIFDKFHDPRYVVYTEYPITFSYLDKDMKALCDLLVIDHIEKKVYIYDLKSSGWDVGNFEFNILKNKYYLQMAIYHKAVESIKEFAGYEIVPMQFIVISTDSQENPLIYESSKKDIALGLEGFTKSGKFFKGVNQIISEINWHLTYDIWNISYSDYQNKGIRKISLLEE